MAFSHQRPRRVLAAPVRIPGCTSEDSCLQLQDSLVRLLLSYWRGRVVEVSQRASGRISIVTQDTANPGSLVGKVTSWILGYFYLVSWGGLFPDAEGDLHGTGVRMP